MENKKDQSKKIQVKLKQPKKEQVKKDVCANKTIKKRLNLLSKKIHEWHHLWSQVVSTLHEA